jgi:general secretion pathway protein D
MQKTPTHRSSNVALALMAVAASMPATITTATAGEGGGYQGSGQGSGGGIAYREQLRRQEAVRESDRLLLEGRDAYQAGDFEKAVGKYREALAILPNAPLVQDRRNTLEAHLADGSVALSQYYRKVGKFDEARALLEPLAPTNALASRELEYLNDPIRTNPALTYEHVQNVDKVRRGLYMAEGHFNLGKFDDAKREYEKVLNIDPHNTAARRGMERVAARKSDYYRAAYDHTRAELLMEVDKAWELAVPVEAPDLPISSNTGKDDSGSIFITEKLRRIIIPSIRFQADTTVEEAVNFLRQRSRELDTLEVNPDLKGVNFVIRRPASADGGGAADDAGADLGDLPLGGGNLGGLRVGEMFLNNVPLAVALQYICDAANLRYRVDDFAVTLVPLSESGDTISTRSFVVPPDFRTIISQGAEAGGGGGDVDPFAAPSNTGLIKPQLPIKDLLQNAGVNFGDGTSAILTANGVLTVTNTPLELEKVEGLVDMAMTQKPKQVKITTKFVEISQENTDELGFDWIVSPFGTPATDTLIAGGGTIGNGLARTGQDFTAPFIPGVTPGNNNVTNIVTSGLRSGDGANTRNSIDAILNNPNRTAQQAQVAPGIMSLTGVFSDGSVKMIMRGLAQKKGTDLMTAPSVTAQSGQKATIEIIREFIYPTEYEPPELPQTFGNNNQQGGVLDPITGVAPPPSFPVTPATPTAFETRNTGVTLEIEPTIGENDFTINLRFVPEIVEFEGFINYGSPIQTNAVDILGNPVPLVITENRIEMPVFSSRRVNTQLTIYDGYTVAVGGLMREDIQNVEDKVPILGDIPIIGRLFQSKAENRIKSNLIIFVTAEIIDASGRRLRGQDSDEPVANPDEAMDLSLLPPI